jgi:hypothetical protein
VVIDGPTPDCREAEVNHGAKAISLVIGSGQGSKHPDAISSPFKAGLPNPKKICSLSNTTEINIEPQISNVIVQLRHPRRAQNLVIRFCEETDVVGSFFAPNRKIKNKVLRASRDSQGCLTITRLALPANHRSFTKI